MTFTSNNPEWPYEWEPFPTDEMTLTLLESACNINPDSGHTELLRFLDMTAGPVKSVSMNGIEYDSVDAALADHEYDTPPILEIEREPGHEPHSQTSAIISLIVEIRRLRQDHEWLTKLAETSKDWRNSDEYLGIVVRAQYPQEYPR